MIDQRRYADFHARLGHRLRRWIASERRVRRALQIIADGEKRAGDCAFAINEEVFRATDFRALALDAQLKWVIYSALAEMQKEDCHERTP